MIVPGPPRGAAASVQRYDLGSLTLERQVQCGLNLFLHLKTPAQMEPLLRTIASKADDVDLALKGLHYVHFARFLPAQDGSALMVITVFDGSPDDYHGSLESYLMDFVATLGDVFTAILTFVKDAPRLPVQRYPRDFVEFVKKNSMPPEVAQPWSAYPEMTVIDILSQRGAR